MESIPNLDKGINETARPLIMSPEELDIYSRFIKSKVEGWHKINPDVVLVCESTALPLAFGIKEAFQTAYPDKTPDFHRFNRYHFNAHRFENEVPTYESVGNFDLSKVHFKLLIETSDEVLRNRIELLQSKKDGKIIIFDETPYVSRKYWYKNPDGSDNTDHSNSEFMGSENPVPVILDGVMEKDVETRWLGKAKDKIFFGNTAPVAIVTAMRLGFKNIWVDLSMPKEYYGNMNNEGRFSKISKKGFSGPMHGQDRELAENTLHDFKLAGVNAAKSIKV